MEKTFNLFRDFIAGRTAFEQLEKIWRDYYADNVGENCYAALMQREIRKNSVIFMSINPSLRKKDMVSEKTKGYNPVPESHKDNYFIDCTKEIEDHSDDSHFNKFFIISEKANLESWSTMDLLYIRDTEQQRVEDITRTESGERFIIEQMKLSFDILQEIKPRLVVVANNGAVNLINLFKDKLNLRLDYPNESNGFIYKINGIPFITLESKYLGSSRWWNRDLNEEKKRLKKLVAEIHRVLES